MRRLVAIALCGLLGLGAAGAEAKPRAKRAKRVRAHVTRVSGHIARPALVGVGPGGALPAAPGAAPASPGDAPPPPPPVPDGTGRALQVRTDDRDLAAPRLLLSRSALLAGSVKVEFNNSWAQDPHNLVLAPLTGAGTAYVFDTLADGAVTSASVPLAPGRWKLYCALADHEARGMAAQVTVG